MNNRSVIIISSEFPPGPGGIGKHAYDLCRALSWKGFSVTVLATQDFSSESEIDNFNIGIDSFSLIRFRRAGKLTYLKRWLKINEQVKKINPEFIIVTGRFSLWMGAAVKLKFGNRFQVKAFIHGSEFSTKNKFFRKLTVQSIKKIDQLWSVSSNTAQVVKLHTGRNDINILPNGVWPDDWINDDGGANNNKLLGSPSLLTVGRISPRKGQHRVIQSLPLLVQRYPEIHYHIVGLASERKQIEALAHKLKVNKNITIHGKAFSHAHLKNYYSNSDIFIMLSENQPDGDIEGFGIAILEANHFGLPAIGARGSGIEDAVKDGFSGRLVHGDDAVEIEQAITDILNDYNKYSHNSKIWAEQHNWKQLIDTLVSETDAIE